MIPIVQSKRKPFDRGLYNIADPLAKKCITKYLTDIKHIVDPPTENYGVDLHSTLDGDPYYHEVEMKFMWKGEWPKSWGDIHIPYRKNRLIKKIYGENPKANFYFYIIRGDCQQAWKMNGKTVQSSEVVEVPNRRIHKGEYFFKVPVDKAELLLFKED